MATLRYRYGDPNYLKVVLLKELVTSLMKKESWSLVNMSNMEGDHQILSLELENGTRITSANEICRLMCMQEESAQGIAGKDSFQRALVDYWSEWESRELQPAVYVSILTNSLSEGLLICLGRLEGHMSTCGGQYLLNDILSLADVLVWATLYALVTPEASTSICVKKDYPLVSSWFISLAKNASVIAATWKASDEVGYAAYPRFLSKKRAAVRTNLPQRSNLDPILKDDVDSAAQTIPHCELEAARSSWDQGHLNFQKPKQQQHPILPVPGKRNILITSALPYVNNVPHLGNIIGCVLSADVFARYCRLQNYQTLYICGTDEYGTATETKALQEGLTPAEVCQKYYEIHSSIYDWFGIQFDYFGRTSTAQQTEIAQDIFWRLHERGFITKATVDQLLCQHCNMYLADRFVEGTCPICAYVDARGDQCDKCGKLINATELRAPRCKMCSSMPILKTSDHLFLDLAKLEPVVKRFFEKSSSEGVWTANAEQITSGWLRDGLKPRCITRDLKWGTAVPLKGYEEKVFYVWFDAPIGYLSITACYTKEWERWWKNPRDVQLYQFMAKDNVPFHTVVFPCSLLGADDNYTLLNHISSTEYLNYENGKFSKSRGVGVFGNHAKETNIPADIFRFYLLYIRPETQDSAFSWDDLVVKNNSELLNNLGNFINRVLKFSKNNFSSTIQEVTLTEKDAEFIAKVNRELTNYIQCLEKIKIRDGLRHSLALSRLGNIYIQANEPWVLVKGCHADKCRAGSVIGLAANVVCLLSVMIAPYMPTVCKQVQEQLQVPDDCNMLTDTLIQFLPPGHKIGTPEPIFSKIEESMAQSLKEKFAGKQQQTTTPAPEVGGEIVEKESLQEQLEKQSLFVRELKSQGVDKERLDAEVKKLLGLKQKLGIGRASNGKKTKK